MADDTVDILLIFEVEIRARPIVAGVALRTHALIAARIGAEIVHQVALAQDLAHFRALVLPRPVGGLHELMAGFVMAGQAGLCNLGAIGERAFQRFKLAVVRRRIRRAQLLLRLFDLRTDLRLLALQVSCVNRREAKRRDEYRTDCG